jgi:hypothetical protein
MAIIEGRIIGNDDDRTITIDGVPVPLEASLKVRNHSPTGFCWGYHGSGPAQAALAILLFHTSKYLPLHSRHIALAYYQAFKEEFIARQPMQANFTIEVDITQWLTDKVTST